MKQKFLSSRWYGRLLNLLVNLAHRKGISLVPNEGLTLQALYEKVWAESTLAEKTVIDQLLQKWSEQKRYEEEQRIPISDEENKKQQEKGANDVVAILRQGKRLDLLVQEVDFSAQEEILLASQKKAKSRKRIIYGSFIAAIILAFVIYNLPYFKERRFYNKVVKEQSIYTCQDYCRQFPNGKHYEDVMFLEMNLSSNPVNLLMEYLKDFPEGKYSPVVNSRLDSLWDIEILKYEQRDKTKESPKAVKYMTEMLHYMKRNRINTILLEMNPNITLKDFDEYDEDVKEFLYSWYRDEKLPLEGNLLSLKENFTEQDRGSLMQILADGVQKSFNNMFSKDLVSVVTSSYEAAENSPVLSFNYVVKNRSDEQVNGLPNIWTYVQDETPKAYILAIDVEFDAKFSIPGSDITYEYSEVGDPGNEITGIEDVKDGYRRMTTVCFAKFSDKMAENLGLEDVYFKEE